jgi:AcrR family transcriptional regulator
VTNVSGSAGRVDAGAGPGTAPGASGAAAEADGLRERLLRAAAAVFARQGYDGTKIMDIVRESGLSTGAVYGRFRSKNDLLREAIVTRSSAAARLGSEGIDRVADLIAAGVTHTDRPLSDAEALRLEAYVTARREPEVAQALAESVAAFRERMAPLAEAARIDGTISDDIDPDAVVFLVRILHMGLLLHRGSGLPGPDDKAWQVLVERLVASFGDPERAAPPPPPVAEPESDPTTTDPTPTTTAPIGEPEDQR